MLLIKGEDIRKHKLYYNSKLKQKRYSTSISSYLIMLPRSDANTVNT